MSGVIVRSYISETFTDVAQLANSSVNNGSIVSTNEYTAGTGKGGGIYKVTNSFVGVADTIAQIILYNGNVAELQGDASGQFNAFQFGALGDGSTDDTAAMQAAIDFISAGETLFIPATNSYYNIPATNTATAIAVDKAITIIVEGEVRLGGSVTYQASPPAIFYVTADNVTIKGSGTLRGHGSYNSAGTDKTYWVGLIFLDSCSNIVIDGINFVNPPKGAIYMNASDRVAIRNCSFIGGQTFAEVAGSHNHANIYCYGGGDNVTITDNLFDNDTATGRVAVTHILNATDTVPNNWVVSDNRFFSPHEHCTYMYLNNSVVADNSMRYTAIAAEQQGSALKMGGDYNAITGNTIYNCDAGGIDDVSPRYNIIANNVIDTCGQTGIVVRNNTAITHALDGNIIANNYLKGTGTGLYGIRYEFNTSHGTDNGGKGGKIIGNTIVSYGASSATDRSSITMGRAGAGSSVMEHFTIAYNTITDSKGNGIYVNNANKTDIRGNRLYDNTRATFRAIYLDTCVNTTVTDNIIEDYQGTPTLSEAFYTTANTSDAIVENNQCYGATASVPIGLNTSRNVTGHGNRLSYTDNLNGTFTLNNVSSLLINNANVIDNGLTSPNTTILIIPLSALSAGVMGSSQSLYVSAKVTGTSFTVKTSDATTVAASDHVFAYRIF